MASPFEWKQHQLRTLRHEKHDATLRGKPERRA
jgi:hypothetical protein